MSFGIWGQIFGVVSSGLKVYAAYEDRQANKKTAKDIRAASALDQDRKRREISRLKSKQRVAYAKSGVKMDGTPTAVLEDTEDQGQMDIDLIKAQGEAKSGYYEAKADQAGVDSLFHTAGAGVDLFGEDKSGVSLASRLF